MRQFKDEGPKIQHYKFMLAAVIGTLSFSILNMLFLEGVTAYNIFSVILGAFLLWCIKWNGYYKLARKWAEYNLRKKDNKWRNYK